MLQWKFITFEYNTNFETLKRNIRYCFKYGVYEIKIMVVVREQEKVNL